MKTILILGANSAMAKALCRQMAGPEVQLLLAGRNIEEMEKTAGDIELRCLAPKPIVLVFDAMDLKKHQAFIDEVMKKVAILDQVYLFFGQLKEQADAQKNYELAHEMMMSNYVGAVSILEKIAAQFEKQKQGMIIGVSSVAGDRGRQSNYLYGSSKAALTVYLQGLRNRLLHHGVHVLTVKPGFVDTPMTSNLKKGFLFASPETIAKGMLKAVRKSKNTVYLPSFWKWIMLIIKMVPETIFKRLKL